MRAEVQAKNALRKFNRARFRASLKCDACVQLNGANGTAGFARYLCPEHTFVSEAPGTAPHPGDKEE